MYSFLCYLVLKVVRRWQVKARPSHSRLFKVPYFLVWCQVCVKNSREQNLWEQMSTVAGGGGRGWGEWRWESREGDFLLHFPVPQRFCSIPRCCFLCHQRWCLKTETRFNSPCSTTVSLRQQLCYFLGFWWDNSRISRHAWAYAWSERNGRK